MAESYRPLRTIKALAETFKTSWSRVVSLKVTEDSVEVAFAPEITAAPASIAALRPEPTQEPKPLPEPPLNDADLALFPPAGMLQPLPVNDEEAN